MFPLTPPMRGSAADKGHQKDPSGSSAPSYDSHYPGHLVPLIHILLRRESGKGELMSPVVL